MKKCNIIVATDLNSAIGYNNKLLFNLKDDLKYFKKITTGGIVIMGNNTYKSIGKPLKNRINIVISSKYNNNEHYDNENEVYYTYSPERALEITSLYDRKVFVIGGSKIYDYFIEHNLCNHIYLTRINKVADNADAFFPILDLEKWKYDKISELKEENGIKYNFIEFSLK